MIKGKTESGFQYEIDRRILKDYRFMKAIAESQENEFAVTKIVTFLLGAEQEEKLFQHVQDKDGYVDIDLINKEVIDIFNQSKEIKNS